MIVFSYIKQVGGKWRVLSESGRNLGTYPTRAGAEKRLTQVEMFKHIDKKRKRRRRKMAFLLLF